MREGSGRAEVERRIVQRSIEDEAFRRSLIEDPKGAVEEELGTRLPEDVRVVAVEETADTIYLVLPSASVAGAEGEALSDRDLNSVAAGCSGETYIVNPETPGSWSPPPDGVQTC